MPLISFAAALVLPTLAAAAALHAPSHRLPQRPARATAARMIFGPPEEIKRISTPDWRFKESSCSPAEIAAMWSAFERVYGSRQKALEASRKNQAVILPYLNSPENVLQAHKALIGVLGKEGAARVLEQNPGVLSCDPKALSELTAAEIESTAARVAWFDELDPNVKAGIPFLTWFAIVGAIGGRVVSCGGGACGSAAEWDLKGGFGPQLVEAIQGLLP